jgi:hypothetical protein
MDVTFGLWPNLSSRRLDATTDDLWARFGTGIQNKSICVPVGFSVCFGVAAG